MKGAGTESPAENGGVNAGWRAIAVGRPVAAMLVVMGLVAAGVGAVLMSGAGRTADGSAPRVGQVAPDISLFEVRNPAHVLRLSAFRGHPVVLTFYASWCGSCYREMPLFQQAYKASGSKLVVLAVDVGEDPGQARQALDAAGATFPAVLDRAGTAAATYRIPGVPATYFIDTHGIVRAFGAGEIDQAHLRAALVALGASF